MPKPDRKPSPDSEPEYDVADVEHDDTAQASYDDIADPDYDAGADPEYDDTVQTDYEPVADPDYDELVPEPVAAESEPVVVPAPEPGFAFELGGVVLPLTQQRQHLVVWRGQLKERHPSTGLVCRVPVYRLDDGYWDCYREEELQAA